MGGVCALGLSAAKKSTSLTNQLVGQKKKVSYVLVELGDATVCIWCT